MVLDVGRAASAADQHWALQGYLNGFDAHLLTGVTGQGLPVISQPYGERASLGTPTWVLRAWKSRPCAPYWTGGTRPPAER